ncbi:tetratricopeptide repeat protein [Massilia sp. TS11]|uniref:YfgM family protein n=1 Tax=Massilia sp. TS11 TaxID=2908003 RepID=UPI001EDB3BBF|nr:tetratricopeptide repeat protein [Massilia sp. TS11]MCG2583139.1 tetratricopeptide repeat protein [Massilia sp. TS11]
MAYDLEEQEQLAQFKAFWGQYGNLITWIAIIGMASYAGYNFWNYHQRSQAAQASDLYYQATQAVEKKDNAQLQRIAGDVENKYARTIYAGMTAMAAAKAAFEANDLKTAKAQLQWVIDNGNDEYKAIAKLRLSGVLLDEKAYDAGLQLLAGEFPAAFKAQVAERKGDILAAQDKAADAKGAYKAALDAMDKTAPGRQLVQIKLDALGGA